MRLIVDAQLPPALARFLSAKGCDAVHVEDLGLRFAEDPEILLHALTEHCAVVTKDEDFFHRWQQGKRDVPVVWLCCGNIRNPQLFQLIEPLIPEILRRLDAGDTLLEFR